MIDAFLWSSKMDASPGWSDRRVDVICSSACAREAFERGCAVLMLSLITTRLGSMHVLLLAHGVVIFVYVAI